MTHSYPTLHPNAKSLSKPCVLKYKSGPREAATLAKLNSAGPDDKRQVVRLERTFQWHGHVCIVMEELGWNLRGIQKRFGKDFGLSIAAVKAYTIQISLYAIPFFIPKNLPNNIHISSNKTALKVCDDLGSAADASSAEPTPIPYLISRFYRAPGTILGLPHDSFLDTWSVGCTLFELYTHRILFPGQTNPKFGAEHFDDLGAFFVDSSSGGDGAKVFSSKAKRDVKMRLLCGSEGRDKGG
ncbi:kinase-like domain-containing protein [Flagelloscypha sp. PMI_526]|nr:kinase-like domain-containing protein [Flagelloscypha sp. PMI_526]